MPFEPRADEEFAAYFNGEQPLRLRDIPSGASISEGPFAGAVVGPSKSASTARPVRAARAAPVVPEAPTQSAATVVATKPAGVKTGERFFMSKDDVNVEVKMAFDGMSAHPQMDMSGSSQVNASAAMGGTPPVVGSDAENLPSPPNQGPMKITTAPQVGKKAPSSKSIAGSIAAAMAGKIKRKDVPAGQMPTAPTSDQVQEPENNGRDRASTTALNSGSTQNSVVPNEKIGEILRVMGVPPSMVSEASVLWTAAATKIAASASTELDVSRDDAHPLAIYVMLGSRYGDEWLDWDMEVIQETLAQDTGKEPSKIVMNKIAALHMVIMSPDEFFNDWYAFEKISIALDGQPPRWSLVEDLEPEQMASAVGIVTKIVPGHDFSAELKKYAATRLFDAGFILSPPSLGFCDPVLSTMIPEDQQAMRKRAFELYIKALKGDDREINVENPTPETVQVSRLLRCHAYVLDRADDLIGQMA